LETLDQKAVCGRRSVGKDFLKAFAQRWLVRPSVRPVMRLSMCRWP
jgi:hypothetical protein